MVYPPLTRMRASADNVPQPIMEKYYAERATKGGLMISEGTYVDPRGVGYLAASGIYSQVHVAAWKPVVQAVKAKGAIFFCQLWHCGRACHPALIGGLDAWAPSAVAIEGRYSEVTLPSGEKAKLPTPHAMDASEIRDMVERYRQAARNAIDAGFDGVELHAANGYLIDQFTKSSSNKRTDEYGGSIENRCRFALEIAEAVVSEVGADRVGIRLSPYNDYLDCIDESPVETFLYLIERLNTMNLAYAHLIEPRVVGHMDVENVAESLTPFRKVWKSTLISAGGFQAKSGAEAIASGHADLIAFGRLWLSNPDLPKRFQLGAPLNRYDRETFYTPGPKGYIDYPFLEE